MSEPTPNPEPTAARPLPTFPTAATGADAPYVTPLPRHPVRPAAPPEGAEGEPYRSLSTPALAGAGVAVLYAAVVVIGAVVSLISGSPFLMATWTLVLPIGAAALSLAGWLQVQRSGGTRAGGALALWGLGLSALFGLSYWAYYAATYFAVRQQADSFTMQWFERLREGDVDRAFRLCLEPDARPADDDRLHLELEKRNAVGEGGAGRGGPVTMFQQSEVVQMLRQGGADTTVRPLGVTDWGYRNGGYEVRQNYEVTTPEAVFTLSLLVRGKEVRGKEYEGRQWQVAPQSLDRVADLRATEVGQKTARVRTSTEGFLRGWQGAIMARQFDEAYFGTLPPAQREAARAAWHRKAACLAAFAGGGAGAGGRGGLTAAALAARGRQATMPGYAAFAGGGLFRLDPKRFWPADPKRQAEVQRWARWVFDPPASGLKPAHFELEPRPPYFVGRKDGHYVCEHAAVLYLLPLRLTVEAVLYLECDADAVDEGRPPAWRVRGVDLLRSRDMTPDPRLMGRIMQGQGP